MFNIRNFCIIAHIDHGKSTLADRLLEYTGTVAHREMKNQILDSMYLERKRGITIKAKTIRINYVDENSNEYVLNLIDTPGHVDFTYEVSRSLAACEGAILVIDATQGIEAQTLANTVLAKNAKLKIIPVINKIDLPTANINDVYKQIKEYLKIDVGPILASAKEGIGIKKIIDSIVMNIPSPLVNIIYKNSLSALIFDSFYNSYRGIIIIVRIFCGKIKEGMKVKFMASGAEYEVIEVGYMKMKMIKSDELSSGEVGYVICGIKNVDDVKVGDTVTGCINPIKYSCYGYKKINPFVFAGLYPNSTSEYNNLKMALAKLKLSDSSFIYFHEISIVLGFGFRCGFLGSLHLEIIKERLEREFGLNLLVTAPNVAYNIKFNGKFVMVDNPSKFPNNVDIEEIFEPYIKATIVCPANYLGAVFELCQKRRGKQVSMKYMDTKTVILEYHMPLAETIVNFYDDLKSASSGYASFDYEHVDFCIADLVKLEIMINSRVVDAFTVIVHKSKVQYMARCLSEKLRNIIPRHMFEISIQAKVSNKIIARETISAMRKDVLAKCYGGDITRKRKLLEKQKEGKRKMRRFGTVEVPSEAFMAFLKIGN
ncbi:MAG: translation elongation factor 4 [Endomicrobium sp.]|jgi:GTP-binding protein LepA|nr:translation elongation factor 4 [Endomicrobium sp.]